MNMNWIQMFEKISSQTALQNFLLLWKGLSPILPHPHPWHSLIFVGSAVKYSKVTSFNTSCLEAHAQGIPIVTLYSYLSIIFRLPGIGDFCFEGLLDNNSSPYFCVTITQVPLSANGQSWQTKRNSVKVMRNKPQFSDAGTEFWTTHPWITMPTLPFTNWAITSALQKSLITFWHHFEWKETTQKCLVQVKATSRT